jgi:hypothetical protein
MDDRQAIKQLEADGRHDKQIDSGDVRSVIAEKGLPALRRRPASSHDILGDGRLGDLDAELEQFAVNTRRTPQRVLPTDPSDETLGVRQYGRSASQSPRLPAPEQAKANSVPAQQGLWLEDDRRREQGGNSR